MTVSPDEGMQLLQQRMAAGQFPLDEPADPAGGPEPDEVAGGELGIMVRLAAALEGNTAAVRAAGVRSRLDWSACHLIEIPPMQQAAAGTLDDPDRWGPNDGWVWQVMGVAVVLGAGGTSWSVWEDSANDPTNLQLTSAVSGRWEPSDYFMMPGSRLVYTSAGGGLTVCKGKAVEIAIDALPGYLGLRAAGRT